MVGGEADAPVRPRRLRVPLIGEHEPVSGHDGGRLEREPRGPPHLLGQLALEQVDDVRLAALEHGETSGLVGDRLEDEPLHARDLPPVLLVGLQHQLDARGEGHEAVGTGPDGALLEAVVADLLHVLPRDDPAGAGGQAPVVGHEIGPRLLEPEAHPTARPRPRPRRLCPSSPSTLRPDSARRRTSRRRR